MLAASSIGEGSGGGGPKTSVFAGGVGVVALGVLDPVKVGLGGSGLKVSCGTVPAGTRAAHQL